MMIWVREAELHVLQHPCYSYQFHIKVGTFFGTNITEVSLSFPSRVVVLCCSHSEALHGQRI